MNTKYIGQAMGIPMPKMSALDQLLDTCEKLNPGPGLATPEDAARWVKSFNGGGDINLDDLCRAYELLFGEAPLDGYDPQGIMDQCRSLAGFYE